MAMSLVILNNHMQFSPQNETSYITIFISSREEAITSNYGPLFQPTKLNPSHWDLILLIWFKAGWRILYKTHKIAGATTIRRSCPLLSLPAASAIAAISLADVSGVDMKPDPAHPPSPSPSPTIIPFVRIRLIWLSAGWKILNSTHAMAGMMGSSSASPRLSPPSAISAICWAAMAASQVLRPAKKAPVMAGPAHEADRVRLSGLEDSRPFGRFWMDRRKMGLVVGLQGFRVLGELLELKHFALRMAIDAMVAAIDGLLSLFVWKSLKGERFWQAEERVRCVSKGWLWISRGGKLEYRCEMGANRILLSRFFSYPECLIGGYGPHNAYPTRTSYLPLIGLDLLTVNAAICKS